MNARKITTCLRGNQDSGVEDEIIFARNGNKLLEQITLLTNGEFNPIRIFSARELKEATCNFDKRLIIQTDSCYNLYKGILQDSHISVKKIKDNVESRNYFSVDSVVKEIVFTSVLGVHDNVLKLLGCCLETNWPILVFEYPENGTLEDCLFNANRYQGQPLTWKCRVKIAVDLCNVVSYLHNAFPNPIIHRDIKPSNISLNRCNSAKLSDFSLSIAIPEDHSHAEDKLVGTLGYIAPEYMTTGWFDEKIDVYSVGGVLLVLLTGKRTYNIDDHEYNGLLQKKVAWYMAANRFDEIVDRTILEQGPWRGKEQQLQAFARIALQCRCDVEDRPSISQVQNRLSEIYQSIAP